MIYGHERLKVISSWGSVFDAPASPAFQKNKKSFDQVSKFRRFTGALIFPVYDILSGVERAGNLTFKILKETNRAVSKFKCNIKNFVWSSVLGMPKLKKLSDKFDYYN